MVHERYRLQTDDRQTDGRQHIANVYSLQTGGDMGREHASPAGLQLGSTGPRAVWDFVEGKHGLEEGAASPLQGIGNLHGERCKLS